MHHTNGLVVWIIKLFYVDLILNCRYDSDKHNFFDILSGSAGGGQILVHSIRNQILQMDKHF